GFTIYAYGYPCYSDMALEVYHGTTVGHKAICAFPGVKTEKIEIRFAQKDPDLTGVKCYHV
ncbi:MAG: hypothetical protein MSA72_09675, partial [Lachnospiraceae bacterium]|nr:hypothetical protein [Lachnospiraceae bacterium]